MKRYWGVGLGLLAAPVAYAQAPATRTIEVAGTGTVMTMPDVATLAIALRGEGASADAATSALAARQKAAAGGLASLLGGDSNQTTGNVTVAEARGDGCGDGPGMDLKPRLSTGDCAVAGYVATIQMTVRTRQVAKAATAAGLASRLGASEAQLEGFELSDPDAALARARAAAVDAARRQATALAESAGVRLGRVVTVRDQMSQESVDMTAPAPPAMQQASAPPPIVTAPPIEIKAKPSPIDSRAKIFVTYAIAD